MEQNLDKNRLGSLKIFFGYSAGSGKTLAMLKAARHAKEAGIDVVVGCLEPDACPETEKLIRDFEVLKPLTLRCGEKICTELDVDAAIRRRPSLLLISGIAHANAPGCRHVKRFQDVQELMKAGINIYTTLNVQQIESLNDTVAAITGMEVSERIPDHIFDNADKVELVDIDPEELLKKTGREEAGSGLGEMSVGPAGMAELSALRELALRRTAEWVNRVSEKIKPMFVGPGYYTKEHVMICLSTSPSNEKVIRTAARMANAFRGNFTALFVETSSFERVSEVDKARLRENFKLAEQLGARVAMIYGDDVAVLIAEYARLSEVSRVVLGRTNSQKRYFFSQTPLAERLIELVPNLNIHIIPDQTDGHYRSPFSLKWRGKRRVFSLGDGLKTLGILLGMTLISFGFQHVGFNEANIITIYILGVLATALVTSDKVYSLVSSVLSVVIYNFFFTIPLYSLSADDPGCFVTFLIMFLAALITGSLTMRTREQARQAAQMAYRTQILLETNQKLQQADGVKNILRETAMQLVKMLNRNVVIYPADGDVLAEPQVFCGSEPIEDRELYTSGEEMIVAEWVFKNNKHAGAATHTFPNAKCLYLAVKWKEKVYAVAGITMENGELDSFEGSLLVSVLGECALTIEKELLREARKKDAVRAQQEQLRANLLRAISHDLRTPLTSISGNAGILLDNAGSLNEEKKRILYMDILDDSMWLINLVENLLSVTRIEDGTMNLRMMPELVEEVVAEALRHVDRRSVEHVISVELKDDFLMARMDSRLIVQVLINLIDNAIKYTQKGSEILISADRNGPYVELSVADDGGGIPDDLKGKLFDMFFTGDNQRGDGRRGLGLGLSLCKTIVNAHGGRIEVYDNVPRGTVFCFSLPAEEVKIHE